MTKEKKQQIMVPEGVKISLNKKKLLVDGPLGKIERDINLGKISLKIENDKIVVGCKNSTKKEKKIIKTSSAHIRNMIKGVQNKFEYKLKICFNHFPFTLKVEGCNAVVKNFLGEKKERSIEIPKGAEIKIDKDIITVNSIDKEIAGQTAANLEKLTRIRGRDVRVFQDGIYMINKNGKEI
jgi:large subunit ribosomal protein L6